MDRANRLIVPRTIWVAQLLPRHRWACAGNEVLAAGRRDVMSMLAGLSSPGVFRWVELGDSNAPIEVDRQTGCDHAVIDTSTGEPFRASGTWTESGGEFTLNVEVQGSTLVANIREAALYASSRAGAGAALYRVVFPSVLPLTAANTLVLSVHCVP